MSFVSRFLSTVISRIYTAKTEERAAIPIGDLVMSNIPSPRMEQGLNLLIISVGISPPPPLSVTDLEGRAPGIAGPSLAFRAAVREPLREGGEAPSIVDIVDTERGPLLLKRPLAEELVDGAVGFSDPVPKS